jgi:hypothetical protein
MLVIVQVYRDGRTAVCNNMFGYARRDLEGERVNVWQADKWGTKCTKCSLSARTHSRSAIEETPLFQMDPNIRSMYIWPAPGPYTELIVSDAIFSTDVPIL